jgi:hypothetical protein
MSGSGFEAGVQMKVAREEERAEPSHARQPGMARRRATPCALCVPLCILLVNPDLSASQAPAPAADAILQHMPAMGRLHRDCSRSRFGGVLAIGGWYGAYGYLHV